MPDIQNIPTTQYIGPRIIPHLWDPIIWDAETQYDALAVVQYNGVPYIARYVPPQGTLPTNTEYWVRWADFNAQMAQLQQTVESFDNRITANATDIDTLEAIVPRSAFSATNTVQKAINAEVTARQQAVSAETTARQQAVSAEATARESADSAIRALLPASSFSSSNTVASQLASVRSDLTALQKSVAAQAIRNDGILLLGDSYSQGVHAASATESGNSWQDLLISKLHLTNVYKYRAGSAGFIARSTNTGGSSSTVPTNTTYNDVLQYAYTYINGLGKAGDIKHIIIQGGVNDASQSNLDNLSSAITQCIAALHSNFPNAVVHIVYTSCGSTTWQATTNRSITVPRVYKNACRAASATYNQFTNAPWVYGEAASHDGSHPTNAMQDLLAGFLGQVLVSGHAEDISNMNMTDGGLKYGISSDHYLVYPANQSQSNLASTAWVEGGVDIYPANPLRKFMGSNFDIAISTYGTIMGLRFYLDGRIRWVFNGGANNIAQTITFPDIRIPIGAV